MVRFQGRSTATQPEYVRVSELGQWAYCHLAWKLQGQNAPISEDAAIRAGEGHEIHREHGRKVTGAGSALRFRNVYAILAALACLIAFVLKIRHP